MNIEPTDQQKGGRTLRKPWVTLTIDQDLLDRLDDKRRKKITEENKDISRSAYFSDLLRKGLSKAK
jgi:metal-responsive CopG/Arc/MetJ family transcriptional regulator